MWILRTSNKNLKIFRLICVNKHNQVHSFKGRKERKEDLEKKEKRKEKIDRCFPEFKSKEIESNNFNMLPF